MCDEVVQKATEEGSDVSFVVDDDVRYANVSGNDVRLRQALAALLLSAVRERSNAPVETRGFLHRDGEAPAVISFGEPGAVGTATDALKHRELPFDRWRGGMGLALPIAQQVMEVHHGSLWSMPGSRGACAISLPLSA